MTGRRNDVSGEAEKMLTWGYWLWTFVPWWIFPMIAIVIIACGWQFIAPIWALLPKPVKWLLGFIGAILVAVQYGRNKGEKAATDKRAQDNATAINTRKTIDAKVDAMPDADVTRDLERGKWLRD